MLNNAQQAYKNDVEQTVQAASILIEHDTFRLIHYIEQMDWSEAHLILDTLLQGLIMIHQSLVGLENLEMKEQVNKN